MNDLLTPLMLFLQVVSVMIMTIYIGISFVLATKGVAIAKKKLTEGILFTLSLQTAIAILNTFKIASWMDLAFAAILIVMRIFLKMQEESFQEESSVKN